MTERKNQSYLINLEYFKKRRNIRLGGGEPKGGRG